MGVEPPPRDLVPAAPGVASDAPGGLERSAPFPGGSSRRARVGAIQRADGIAPSPQGGAHMRAVPIHASDGPSLPRPRLVVGATLTLLFVLVGTVGAGALRASGLVDS